MPFAFCLSTGAQPETTSLHQWGAVTLFHGLPSDRVRAIAQDADGMMWFGTDAGLARYDGRRVQTVTDEELAARRVLALRFDADGALWVGTDGSGALVRLREGGAFAAIAETKGKSVTAIIAPESGRVILATTDGFIFDCRRQSDDTFAVKPLAEQITAGGAGKQQPLELTSLAIDGGDTLIVGTRGRGLLAVRAGGALRESTVRPRPFFIEAIESDARDARGGQQRQHLAVGAQTQAGDSGLYSASSADVASSLRLNKITDGATGNVTALKFDGAGDLYAATDGQGVLRYRGGQRLQHFTFEGTAGGLRSNRIYSIFFDREGVAWFGTDRGVCRYDARGVGVETVSDDADGNFVRALYRTTTARGRLLLAGTNRGLFARDEASATWREVEGITNKTVYAIAQDKDSLLLVGTAGGLYVGSAADANELGGTLQLATEDAGKALRDDDAGAKSKKTRATAKPSVETAQQSGEPAAATTAGGSVRAIAMFGGETFIATYGRGVERFETGTRRRTLVWPREGDENARLREVVSLYADEAARRLWIGTASGGVFYFDGTEVKTDPALEALRRRTIWSMSGSSSGANDGGGGSWLWLATGNGLYAYRSGGALVEAVPGIDARAVFAISTETARAQFTQAWCATAGAGVFKVSLEEQFGAINARLDAERGLPSQNAFALLLETGATAAAAAGDVNSPLLVGTTRGLARYEPNAAPPKLKLTRVTTSRSVQPEELNAGAPLRLEYPQNSLSLDVAAGVSRTFPEQFQYSFLLSDARGRTVKQKLSHDAQFQIEQLAPGAYHVTARAYTTDLVASAPLVFDFEVARAPFPRTTVALSVLLALALVALVVAGVQHRKIVRSRGALVDANRQLADARLRLENEGEIERRRIARDLHDQTLADLRRLLLLTDEMQRDDASIVKTSGHATASDGHARAAATTSLDPAALRAEIESISQEIRRICEDLSPSVLVNVGFAAALEWALAEQVSHLPGDCKFAYEFACDEDIEERVHFTPGVQMQIYRVVQEAVSNICRHAHATRVRLSVNFTADDDFMLTLEDDGRGFEAQHKRARGGRGLANIRARASLIEAEAEWRRGADGGTIFVLRKSNSKIEA